MKILKLVGYTSVYILHSPILFAQTQSDTLHKTLSEVTISANQSLTQSYNYQQNIDKVLQDLPGVNMIKRGNFAWEPTIRSMSAGQINVTIDGMQIFGACTDKMDPISSYVTTNALDKITVQHSAQSASIGNQIGGNIDFQLSAPKLANIQKWYGNIGTTFETNGSKTLNFGDLNFSTQQWAFNLNGSFQKAQNYTDGSGNEILFSQFQKYNIGFGAVTQLKAHGLQINYLYDQANNVGYPALTMDVAFAKAHIVGVGHTWQKGKWSVKNKIYANYIDHAMDDTKRPAEQVLMHMDMPGTSQTMGMYSNWTYKKSAHRQLKLALNGYNNRLTANMTMYPPQGAPMYMLTLPDAARQLVGVGINESIHHKKWLWDYGARVDWVHSDLYSSAGYNTWSGMTYDQLRHDKYLPSLYMNPSYQITNQWTLSSQLSYAQRAASLQEMYAFYLFNRMDNHDYIGNPDLKTEKAWNTALTLSYQQDAKWKISGTYFHKFLQDYIIGGIENGYSVMTMGASGVKIYKNIDQAQLWGYEGNGQYLLHPQWLVQAQVQYHRGKDDDGEALPLISPFRSHLGINYFNKHDWKVQIMGRYVAAQSHVAVEKYGNQASKAYTLIDINVAKSWKYKSYQLLAKVGVENILNTQYHDFMDIMQIKRPGRNIFMSMNVSL